MLDAFTVPEKPDSNRLALWLQIRPKMEYCSTSSFESLNAALGVMNYFSLYNHFPTGETTQTSGYSIKINLFLNGKFSEKIYSLATPVQTLTGETCQVIYT